MIAIILAGGRGKRLKQITDYVPKSLIPINNIPIIEIQIKLFKKSGVKKFIICTGYKTEQIENYFKRKNNFGVTIKFSKEKTPRGTGGAIKNAAHLINENSFFVINGDVITNINMKLLKTELNSIATIQLKTKFGIVDVAKNYVARFDEKKQIPDLWMNAGIYHLSKNIIKDLPKIGDIEKTTFPEYAKKRKLHFVKYKNCIWHSIDSFKDMEECSKEIKSQKFTKFLSK